MIDQEAYYQKNIGHFMISVIGVSICLDFSDLFNYLMIMNMNNIITF